MRKVITIVLLLLGALQVASQTPLYRNYTTKDGLASNETYWVTQDDSGFIWIATDKGICKYNGQKFYTYTSSDGITDNVIFKIYNDPYNNRLLIGTYTGGLFVYENGVFFEHPQNQNIMSAMGNKPLISLAFKEDGAILLTTAQNNILIEIPNDSTLIFSEPEKGKTIHPDYSLFYFFSNNALVYESKNFLIGKGSYASSINVDIYNKIKKPFVTADDSIIFFNCHPFYSIDQIKLLKNGHYLLGLSNYGGSLHYDEPTFLLLEIDKLNSIITTKPIDKPVSTISEIDNNLYIGITNTGLLKYKAGNLNTKPDTLFANSTPTKIFQDDYLNYWMSTTNNGLYCIPSFKNIKLDKINSTVSSIKSNGSQLLITTTDNELYRIDSHWNATNIKTFNNKIKLYDYKNEKILLNNGPHLLVSVNNGASFKSILYEYGKPIIGTTDAKFISDTGILTIGGGTSAIYTNLKKITKYVITDKSSINNYKRAYLINDTMWIIALQGLFYEKNGEAVKYDHKFLNTRLTDITSDGNKRLFLGSKNHGVIVKYGNNIVRITKNDGIISDIIDKLVWINNALWVISSSGVSKISFDNNNQYFIANFPELTEKSCGKIYDISSFMGKMVIATENGIFTFSDNTNNNIVKRPIVLFTSIQINKKPAAKDDLISSNSNKIIFSYWGYLYGDERPIKYKYLLSGYSKDTIRTDIPEVQFTNLPAGDYKFKLWASSSNNSWTLSPITYSFKVHQYYTETWWFISLIVLASLLVISSIFLLIIRNLKRRNEIQKELLLLEQKALRAQMNPHFTFNALNSIQYFITDNNKRAATTFLSKFSKLVRNILNNSRTNTISLADEISTLTTYLELEQMRFNGKIAIGIHIGDNLVSDDIFIPSMIIQPFVENAIWHGIMPREDDKGKLELSFELKSTSLVCKIKDNGIGRKKSAELKEQTRKGHKSAGLKNIEDRIAVLNHINPKNKIDINITDINNEGVTGTEVIVIFELGKEYND